MHEISVSSSTLFFVDLMPDDEEEETRDQRTFLPSHDEDDDDDTRQTHILTRVSCDPRDVVKKKGEDIFETASRQSERDSFGNLWTVH